MSVPEAASELGPRAQTPPVNYKHLSRASRGWTHFFFFFFFFWGIFRENKETLEHGKTNKQTLIDVWEQWKLLTAEIFWILGDDVVILSVLEKQKISAERQQRRVQHNHAPLASNRRWFIRKVGFKGFSRGQRKDYGDGLWHFSFRLGIFCIGLMYQLTVCMKSRSAKLHACRGQTFFFSPVAHILLLTPHNLHVEGRRVNQLWVFSDKKKC